jgi:Holliday junction resolvase-like predicted endonuclease
MNEYVYQNYIIKYFEQFGYEILHREFFVGNERVDLVFREPCGTKLFIEVKDEKFDGYSAVGQILTYKALSNECDSNFMLVSHEDLKASCKDALNFYGIKYINLDKYKLFRELRPYETIKVIRKGKNPFKDKNDFFHQLDRYHIGYSNIAKELFNFVQTELHPIKEIYCNLSDGLQFQIVDAGEKFLTIGKQNKGEILFHFPYGKKFKEEIIQKYQGRISFEEEKGPNQLDVRFKNVTPKELIYIKEIVMEAFFYSLNRIET